MSANELAHLFPSRTHPALPVAVQILSTLRALTAPGKGNDLRPEERTALVGVAALLGCERLQNHDLAQAAVQRASSVSPARFKSALATSRKLLASADVPSPSSSRSSRENPSPFATPRKSRPAGSGVNYNLLSPAKHSPATKSPLRHSVTPSKRGAGTQVDEDADATPTKRARVQDHADPPTPSKRSREEERRREREGVAAFLALRPGASPSKDKAPEAVTHAKETETPRGYARPDLEAEIDAVLNRRRLRRLRPRRDWTFRETPWRPATEKLTDILADVEAQLGEGAVANDDAAGKERNKSKAHSNPLVTAIMSAWA